jgi:hypothetical protein
MKRYEIDEAHGIRLLAERWQISVVLILGGRKYRYGFQGMITTLLFL